jgi:hypothetical protein
MKEVVPDFRTLLKLAAISPANVWSITKFRDILQRVRKIYVFGNAAHVARCRTGKETGLISTTPLAFELVCKDRVVATVGDAVGVFGELTPVQHEQHCWKVAIHMLNSALKEPRYLTAATITLQTALNLSGMLAEPPAGP